VTSLRVSEADAGDFRGERLAWDVLHAAGAHEQTLPSRVDLTQTVMLKPYAIACLIALGAKADGQASLAPPLDQRCADYLTGLRLDRWFTGVQSGEAEARDSTIVADQLRHPAGDFADRVINGLARHLNYAVNVSRELANHLDELVLNALTHAESPIGCVVVGQAFPRNQSVEIAVLDLGQTIRGHLSKNPRHAQIASDRDAIEQATIEGVTGTVGRNRFGDPNSGVGLYELRRFCEGGKSTLTILSGSAYGCFASGQGPSFHAVLPRFAGCLVDVQFLSG